MRTLKEDFEHTLEVKQSKFIAHLVPYTNYEKKLKALKQLHPKARHFVVAFRYLNEYNQVVEHSSDDGEPKGTSGKPSLFVLQGAELINAAVIIVRYFGGTKLGTGGLVRAYSDAVNLVIGVSEIIEYRDEIVQTIRFAYSDLRIVEYECSQHEITILEKEFGDEALFKIKATSKDMEEFLEKLHRVVTLVET